MDKKITANYFYNLIYQILLIISPVITVPFLARSLGVSGVGEYSYCYSLTGYFIMVATLGCDIYGRREISYVKDSKFDISKRFWSIQLIKTFSTLIVMIVYIVFSINNDNKIMLFILGIHLLNVPLNIGWFFQGIERFKMITTRGLIMKIIDLLFVIIFIRKPSDLMLYTFGSSFIAFITFFVLWIDLKNYLGYVSLKQLSIIKDLKQCMVFFLPSVATSIYTMLDKTMLGSMTGNFLENGYYEQAIKINLIFSRVVLALGTVLLPTIAYSYKQGDFENVKNNIKKSMKYVYFISFPIALGLLVASDLFVPWFFGAGFEKVSILLKISGFILIFQGIGDVIGVQYLVTTGKQNKYIVSLFLGAFCNFLCNVYFIPKLQSIGAILASLISECIIVCVQLYLIRKDFSLTKLIRLCKKYILASIIMFIVIYPISKFMSPTIIDTTLVGIIGVCVYIVSLFFMRDEFVMNIVCAVKNRIK